MQHALSSSPSPPYCASLFSRGTLAHPISIAFDFHWMAFWLQQHIGLRVLISFSIASRADAEQNGQNEKKKKTLRSRAEQCKRKTGKNSVKEIRVFALCQCHQMQFVVGQSRNYSKWKREYESAVVICLTPSLSLSFSLVPSLFFSLFMPFSSTPSSSRSICHFARAVQKWKPLYKSAFGFARTLPPFLLPFCYLCPSLSTAADSSNFMANVKMKLKNCWHNLFSLLCTQIIHVLSLLRILFADFWRTLFPQLSPTQEKHSEKSYQFLKRPQYYIIFLHNC